MSQSLRDFANSFVEKANVVDKSASDLSVKVAIAILQDLYYVTPVDTSQALSNWQVSLGSKSGSRIPPYFFGRRGSTQEVSAAEAMLIARETLAKKLPGQAIFISNNLSYIRRLDEGSSTQEPAGFVARAELIGRKVAEKG